MSTNYRGIDYSGINGTCNRDADTGIRYGILSANTPELTEWLWESVESVYLPYCPHCNEQLDEDWDGEHNQVAVAIDAVADEAYTDEELDDLCNPICPHCNSTIEDGEQWPDCAEPDSNILQGDGIEGFVDSNNDIWVTKSPYYTHAQFCSPCAPGAGHLKNPCQDGPKTYCLGHDWFGNNVAPYPVYYVATGELVSVG